MNNEQNEAKDEVATQSGAKLPLVAQPNQLEADLAGLEPPCALFTPFMTHKEMILSVIGHLVLYEDGFGTQERIDELLALQDKIQRGVVEIDNKALLVKDVANTMANDLRTGLESNDTAFLVDRVQVVMQKLEQLRDL